MSGIGCVLGYEFRMSLAVPFVHVSFNTLVSMYFLLFFVVFYKNVLAARVRSMVAKGAFMQKFENSFSELLKKTQNVQLWGVKSGAQNLEAIAERTPMAPLGCEFCAPSVLPFGLFLFNKPFLITCFRKCSFQQHDVAFLHSPILHRMLPFANLQLCAEA